MNIREAKEQIKNAMRAYLTKNEYGYYRIPIPRQRPIFMVGPPGVGKTAIMEQIAAELGVGLVSYSMTHHTRQSALGLPYIVEREFAGMKYDVSEYTMSEIIGSVYDLMRDTGVREGILFLDEINCISETLAPCMLQFLQYKVFGRHRIPDGWIVVTAGNPPEYNKSVRDFDIVTWDRLKRIDVEPDYAAWKIYASGKKVHPSVTTYLEAKQKDFYLIESVAEGRRFVTARGWDDLSEMIALYEGNGIAVDRELVIQYIQHRRIANDFSVYYELFTKYRSDYRVDAILSGSASKDVTGRAAKANFDERLALIGLIFDSLMDDMRDICEREDTLASLRDVLRDILAEFDDESGAVSAAGLVEKKNERLNEKLRKGERSSSIGTAGIIAMKQVIAEIENIHAEIVLGGEECCQSAAVVVKARYERFLSGLREKAALISERLTNMFAFCEGAFGDGQEMLLIVTELTVNPYSSRFISRYGSEKYFEHNEDLKFYERHKEISQGIDELSRMDLK